MTGRAARRRSSSPAHADARCCARCSQVPNDVSATQFGDPAIRALVPNLADDGWELAYSYETCGNVNSYSQERHYDIVRDKVFRVSYPGEKIT